MKHQRIRDRRYFAWFGVYRTEHAMFVQIRGHIFWLREPRYPAHSSSKT